MSGTMTQITLEAVVKNTVLSCRLSTEQAAELLERHPTLADHACRQGGVGLFGQRIGRASLPHLVEHLAIDMLVDEFHQPVAGNTTWLNREEQTMLVRLRVYPQIEEAAAKALHRAVQEINELISTVS